MPLIPKQQPPYYEPSTVTPVTVPSKIYAAQLLQNSTSTPTKEEIYNTIGNIVWTRINTGEYHATLLGAFPINKTQMIRQGGYVITPTSTFGGFYTLVRISDDILELRTYSTGFAPADISILIGDDIPFALPTIEVFY